MKLIRSLAVLALIGVANTGWTCEEFQPLDRAQVTDLMNTVGSQDANPLDQIFAFDTLMCSDQSAVRDFALRVGATSINPTIQGQVLLRSIFEMENLQVRLLDVEGLSKDHYERIRARPIESFPIRFRDLSAACASFIRDNRCADESLISISGDKLSIRARWNSYDVDGVFTVQGTKLVGNLSFLKEKLTFPAEIDLF